MHSIRSTVSLVLALAAPLALASPGSGTLSHTFLTGGYAQENYQYANADGHGVSLQASYALSPRWLLLSSYAESATDDFLYQSRVGSIDSRSLTAGLGMNIALGSRTSLVPSLQYQRVSARYQGGFSFAPAVDDDGYQAELRARSRWQVAEAYAGLRYNDIYGRDDQTVFAGAYYLLQNQYALGLEYRRTDLGADYRDSSGDILSAVSILLRWHPN